MKYNDFEELLGIPHRIRKIAPLAKRSDIEDEENYE
jgi:hypothetical protein